MVGGTDALVRRDTEQASAPAPLSVVAASASAIVVSTLMVSAVALFNLDDVTPEALAHDAFRLGASTMFLAACILAVSRLRLGAEDRRATATAGLYGVLALLALPMDNLTGQLTGSGGSAATVSHVVLTASSLLLARRSLHSPALRSGWSPRAVAGLVALAAVAAATVVSVQLSGLAPQRLRHLSVGLLLVELVLTVAWFSLASRATVQDRHRPWAQRLAPLLACLGVVELLRALERLQPGVWDLASAALLASVAMVTTHCSFVDLLDTTRQHVRRAVLTQHDQRPVVRTSPERLTEVDVDEVVAAVAAARRAAGQEIQIRGGNGLARTDEDALATALDALAAYAGRRAPGSPVTIQVVSIADRVEVSVSDRGPGLSPVQADGFFADGGSAELADVQDLVRRCGGDMALTGRIGGATVVVTMPAARVAPEIPLHVTA